jgi:hypothetical protein
MGTWSSCQFPPSVIHVFAAAARCPMCFSLIIDSSGFASLEISYGVCPRIRTNNCARLSTWSCGLLVQTGRFHKSFSQFLTILYNPDMKL